jgi:MFS superfamily sulfate permease-like transporter
MPPLDRYAPGVAALLHYKPADIPADLRAGLAVTAVALPVGIAYAELAGFHPEVGLYSSILPLVAYAIFGTSRQLIVDPDAATCALVAATVTPLAGGDPATYGSLSVMLALLTGLLCVAASFCDWVRSQISCLGRFLSAFSMAWRCRSFSVKPTRFSAFR